MKAKATACELCNEEAILYCDSDAAFLCSNCDYDVHNANFLVARHIRRLICPHCDSFTITTFSGTRTPSLSRLICRSCSPEDHKPDSVSCSSSSTLSSSSARISTTESQTPAPKTTRIFRSREADSSVTQASGKKWNMPGRFSGEKVKKSGPAPARGLVESKADGIFANLCKMLGVEGDLVIPAARRAMSLCTGRIRGRGLPLRVSLAASLWFGMRVRGDKSLTTWQNLRRLQELSGVPVRLILAVEGKLEHALRGRRSRPDLEEGWAECSI